MNCVTCIPGDHHTHPELWLRPSPEVPLPVLSKLIDERAITATLRMGVRTALHPKGYAPGQVVTLRVCDGNWAIYSLPVRIEAVRSKRLGEWREEELSRTRLYSAGWRAGQRDLSTFEGRPVAKDELTSIVEFTYL